MPYKITFFLYKNRNFGWQSSLIFGFLLLIFFCAKTGQTINFEPTIEPGYQANNSRRTSEILVKIKNQGELLKIKVQNDLDLDIIIADYQSRKDVEFAEPNFLYQAAIIPSDKYFDQQWYLKKISAPDAWDAINVSPKVTIAVLDSGVQIEHPDLKSNIWINEREIPENGIDDDKNGFIDDVNGWDFVNNTYDPRPKFSSGFTPDGILHGTIIAGIIAAAGNNNEGVSGITWQTKIMPLKVLDDKGEGDTNNIVKAIDYAINNGADIINFSFVGHGQSLSLESAIKRAHEAGIIMVAAAGNDESQGSGVSLDKNPMYPACHDGKNGENMVIGVAATDPIDQKANFSGYGFKCVDISSPGVSIFSTAVYSPRNNSNEYNFNFYYDGYWSGTSMAAPMVSATAALVESANPGFSKKQVVKTILENTDNINRLNPNYLGQLGAGRLNIFKSVMAAKYSLLAKKSQLINAPFSSRISEITRSEKNGLVFDKFLAYNERFLGGVNVAAGDINGDGQDEVITGPGPGGGPQVRIFDPQGNLKSQFFAYNEKFRGGVNVAAGDINGDGQDEVITGPGPGGGPQVRIFDPQGNLKSQFFAYNEKFRGGVNVAAGDINGDGQDEVITGPGPGGGPQVRIFDPQGNLKSQFFAYNEKFRGGIRISAGNILGGTRSAQTEIVTAPMKGGGPQVIIFNIHGQIINQFFAYDKKFSGGVNLSAADTDNDGVDEIITGAGPGGAPHVKIFEKDGQLAYSYYAFEEKFSGGVNVAAIKIP